MFCYLEVGRKIQNRKVILLVDNFPGRFSTCNLVFRVSGVRKGGSTNFQIFPKMITTLFPKLSKDEGD